MAEPIEFRNADLPGIERGLARLVQLPVQATSAVKIARLARAVSDAAAAVRERRDRLVEEYAARNEEGHYLPAPERGKGMIRIDPDRADDFEAEIRAILDETVTIPGPPLGPADLRREDGAAADVPAAVLLDLGPLFSSDDDA